MRLPALLLGLFFLLPALLQAAPVRSTLSSTLDGTEFEHVLVADPTISRQLPALLMVPNWMGISEPSLAKAEKIAAMGYVVLVADVYGREVRPKDGREAAAAAGAVKGDRALMRARVNAALELLRTLPGESAQLDRERIGAIGFCFGGTTVLELARSGAALGGVVSFHGNLDAPLTYEAGAVKAPILVLHGADDPVVPKAEFDGFVAEMQAGKLDWELISYGGAVHSFTDPTANSPGRAQYHEKVAARAFQRMRDFFAERFGISD